MERFGYIGKITQAFRAHSVVALLGPRQCGKTTLARIFARAWSPNRVTFFDLEDPTHIIRLDNPKLALQDLTGLVVIDEIQRKPGLFEVLRVLADGEKRAAQFLILGSASRDLIRQSSETLAGRIRFIELTPFTLEETGSANLNSLWSRGGFPRSYLADDDGISTQWRKAYISTYLERDIPALGISIPPMTIRRFWMMLAHYHGQVINYAELGRSFGASDTTIKRYIDMLSATFMIRQLPPWYENIAKRQVKSPKIYFRDSGIYHSLLGIQSLDDLHFNPKLGASWEGFALEEVIRHFGVEEGEIYFWAVHSQAELDLLLFVNDRRIGIEFKYSETPKLNRRMLTVAKDLKLDQLVVVYPGHGVFPLAENVLAAGLADLPDVQL